MVRCTLVGRVGDQQYLVRCNTGDSLCFKEESEAICFIRTANKVCRGKWQLRVLVWLWEDGEIEADVRQLMRVSSYVRSYQRSLDALMKRLRATFVPGQHGGRWGGKYVWRWQEQVNKS
jgi:hypothetical protein